MSGWLDSLKSWRSELGKLRRKLELAKQRMETLESLPACKADVIAALEAEIDHFSGAFHEHIAGYCREHFSSRPWLTGTTEGDRSTPRFPMLRHRHRGTHEADHRLLYGVLGESLKREVRAAIESDDAWPECGPPLAERRKEMDKLAKEIAELERQIAEADSIADQAGVRTDG